ncbi:hypothetical protein Tco_1191612 [Tanacetum coccineum]
MSIFLMKVAQVKELILNQGFMMSNIARTFGMLRELVPKQGFPDVPTYDSKSEKESWGNSGEEDDDDEKDYEDESDDGDDDDNDDDDGNDGNDGNGDYDDDANDGDNQEDDDTNDDNEKTDSDKTESDIIKIRVFNQSSTEYYEEEEENILLNLENPSLADNEIASLMDTTVHHEEPRSQTSSLYTVPVTATPEVTSIFTTTIPLPPPLFNPLPQQFNDRVTNLEKNMSEIKQVDQYAQALSSIPAIVDRYIDNKLGEAIQKAIVAHNLDCREEDQAEKRDYIELIDTSMRVILKKKSLEVVVLERSSSQPNSTYEAAASLSEFELTKILIDKMEKSKGVETSKTKIKTPPLDQTEVLKDGSQARKLSHLEIQVATGIKSSTRGNNDDNRAGGKPYPFDLNKPLLLILDNRGHKVIPQDFFINNDLKYLKGGDLSRRYLNSVTKTKAATYKIKWIEDLVRNLWSPVKVIYDKHAYLGTLHWGPKCQIFYGFASNMTSSKDVYSRKQIITVTRLTIMKKYDYGHLEMIQVHREDQQMYTFREGDFLRLRLQDIEDMLLLLVQ